MTRNLPVTRKSFVTTAKRTALAGALFASVAMVAPNDARAVVVAQVAATHVFNLEAPFTTEFVAAFGQRIRINIGKNGAELRVSVVNGPARRSSAWSESGSGPYRFMFNHN